MKKIRTTLRIDQLQLNEGQLDWLGRNPRKGTQEDIDRTVQSLLEDPDFLEDRPLLVIRAREPEQFVVFCGNLRLTAAGILGWPDLPCVIYTPEKTADPEAGGKPTFREDRATVIRRALKDNGTFGHWDYDELPNWGIPAEQLVSWGVETPEWASNADNYGEDDEEDEYERKKKEFEERMKAGEISEEDEEYQAFLEKFQLKKTTDDCYTPDVVYDAVLGWVCVQYGIDKAKVVRPFYPGGDYQKENYPEGSVVVDNPPFSILAEILNFYKDRGVLFFLFAPTLTLFSSSSSSSTALPLGVPITYENGASVNTSFLTNLEDPSIRLRSEPSLYKAVNEANDKNLAQMRKELPKYRYDHHIITAPFIGALSRLGIDFSVPVSQSQSISALEAQKAQGKTIYGKGYIVSEQVFAEREKAEREKAEREKAERWELSPNELEIVANLSKV